jgi:hypothetical protein
VAKDFEVIETIRRVVALKDEEGQVSGAEEDGWESIYAEQIPGIERRTYSDVLRGNDGR